MELCAKCFGHGCEWCEDPPTFQNFRDFLALRYEQIKRLAPMLSMGIQALTLAGVVYGLIQWRGVSAGAIGLMAVGLIVAGLTLAWVWYEPLGMKEPEERARIDMNPRDQYLLTPKEREILRMVLEAFEGRGDELREVLRDGELKRE